MDERILKWLYDIKFALDEINSYFDGKEKNFAEYQNNTMLKSNPAQNPIIKRFFDTLPKISFI